MNGNIWYSKDPFEEGDKIKIYTIIYNPDTRELSGAVSFYDDSTLLGKKSFRAPGGEFTDATVNWTVTAGRHRIFAKIENARYLAAGGKYEEVALPESQTEEMTYTVGKKISSEEGQADQTPSLVLDSKIVNTGLESIKKIGKVIEGMTPAFIGKPVAQTAEKIEDFRAETSITLQEKKQEAETEWRAAQAKKTEAPGATAPAEPDNPEKKDSLWGPLAYAKYFLYKVLALIFSTKAIFYALVSLFILALFRYIWNLIL